MYITCCTIYIHIIFLQNNAISTILKNSLSVLLYSIIGDMSSDMSCRGKCTWEVYASSVREQCTRTIYVNNARLHVV